MLTGLNEDSKDLYHGENLFEDADTPPDGGLRRSDFR